MSLRLEMLQVARLAPSVLGEEACDLVHRFLLEKQNDDGGFQDRDGESDLYYTSFAIDALSALQKDLPEEKLSGFLARKLAQFESLDLVHLCCLVRCFSALPSGKNTAALAPVFSVIEKQYRSADGGYSQSDDGHTGSVYACFLAWGAYADHGLNPPDTDGVARCIESLKSPSGAWANDVDIPIPSVPATAAAISVSRNLRLPIPEQTAQWLLDRAHPAGGFVPFPTAPMPDLLSTAVALHALDGLQVSFEGLKENQIDFVDSLWTAEGGFHGSWDDDELDIEYTYYGLLALGHLAM